MTQYPINLDTFLMSLEMLKRIPRIGMTGHKWRILAWPSGRRGVRLSASVIFGGGSFRDLKSDGSKLLGCAEMSYDFNRIIPPVGL